MEIVAYSRLDVARPNSKVHPRTQHCPGVRMPIMGPHRGKRVSISCYCPATQAF
jgi:hypothetical protein